MRTVTAKDPWPDGEGGIVSLAELGEHRDANGVITNLAEFGVGGVSLINSVRGSVRSNHFHKEDCHYLFTVRGAWVYQECAPGEDIEDARRINVYPGEVVYTPPRRVHRCTFITDTLLVSMSKLPRNHENHESDVVRVGGSHVEETRA